ncbi:MAG: YbhB/YbcL family Raf kinase inhibitor-like protein [Deltaproteobacteria bacterium]|nr:YbhB/YbcL family Raf kinase inhibitor-like protein [Deltaproteobacteria bacterium]
MIPLRHECAPPLVATGPGENVSPALRWTAGPAGTMSYAIVMRDRDARNLVHWVVYDLSASTRSIAEAIPGGYAPVELNGGKQAEIQGSRYFGYFGPCSEGRVNTYVITVHALPTATLPGALRTSTENALATSIEALSIGAATLSGES